MKTRALAFNCPACGSREVFYSCTPNCCFNHVCGDCGASFEPATRALGGKLTGIEPPDPLPESTAPTVGCIKCEATTVYVLEDERLVCASCGALQELCWADD